MKVGLENSIVDAGLAIAVLYSIYRRTILVLSGGPMNLWGHRGLEAPPQFFDFIERDGGRGI